MRRKDLLSIVEQHSISVIENNASQINKMLIEAARKKSTLNGTVEISEYFDAVIAESIRVSVRLAVAAMASVLEDLEVLEVDD